MEEDTPNLVDDLFSPRSPSPLPATTAEEDRVASAARPRASAPVTARDPRLSAANSLVPATPLLPGRGGPATQQVHPSQGQASVGEKGRSNGQPAMEGGLTNSRGPSHSSRAGTSCQGNLRKLSPKSNGLSKNHRLPPAAASVNRPNIAAKRRRQDEPAADMDTEEPRSPKIPPIFLDVPPGWAQLSASLRQLTKNDFVASCSSKSVRITTTTVENFRAVQRYLQDQRIPFHTFALKEEQLRKFVIRGLPRTLQSTEVQQELSTLNFDIVNATLIKTRGGRTTSLWQITLRATEGKASPDGLYDIHALMCCRISVRKYNRPAGPIQCHRCQGFGHGSSHCNRQLRCVRCGEGHPPTLCTKLPGTPATCCNCGAGHTANYKGCPEYKALKSATTKQTPTISATKGRALPTRRVEPGMSFANATSAAALGVTHQNLQEVITEEDEEVEIDSQTSTKRRKRPNRNPANRGPRALAAPAPLPEESGPTPECVWPSLPPRGVPRTAPRKRLEVPHPFTRADPLSPPEQYTPVEPVTSPAVPHTVDMAGFLAGLIQQLTSMLNFATRMLEGLSTQQ